MPAATMAILVALALLVPRLVAHAESGAITEFPLPTANSYPYDIAAGADGNLWFTESFRNSIGRITPAGTITEFPLPTATNDPVGIAAGPDGNLWFTKNNGNSIGRITPAGAITEFPLPTAGSDPFRITAGPDGNLWFTESASIGRITPAGAITEFSLSGFKTPSGIAAGPDGNLWFTERLGNSIGRISTTGTITEFPLPATSSLPHGITAGPDGNLWFTEGEGNRIGRISTTGTITEFPVPTASSGPFSIAQGQDGNLWFTENSGNRIGRITPAGTITEFPLPAPSSGPNSLAEGADGNLWLTESNGNRIGRVKVDVMAPPTTAPPTTTTPPPASSTDSWVASKANEPSMAVNPKNNRDILIGYNTVTSDGNQIACGYARSLDGGVHWNRGILAQPAGLTRGLGDPSVAFSSDGRAFLSCLSGADADNVLLDQVEATALVVASAPADSIAFGTPVIVTQDYVQHKARKGHDYIAGSIVDQEHLAVSPVTRRAIMCYTEFTYSNRALERRTKVVYALDIAGTLWSSPQLVSSAGEAETLGCTVAVTGSGRVWVAYWNVGDDNARATWSDTNGRQWSKPRTLGPKTTAGSIDEDVLARRVSVAADPNPGSMRAVVAWASSDPTGARAAVQMVSTDGTTWSQPRQVSDPSVAITRQPAVAFGADGMLALGYYDQVGRTVTYNVGQSAWPGAAPFKFHAVASAPSSLDITFDTKPFRRGLGLGDYTSVAEANGTAFASWGDDRAGDQLEVWFGT